MHEGTQILLGLDWLVLVPGKGFIGADGSFVGFGAMWETAQRFTEQEANERASALATVEQPAGAFDLRANMLYLYTEPLERLSVSIDVKVEL